MKIQTVGINPTSQQTISLTPELLASTGARYSRNNEGLEAILEKIKGMDQDKAVDAIFKMVDYGHRSISDMAPVAIFMDDISIYMALKIWHLCPTAGGQESSTRYVKLSIDKITKPQNATDDFNEKINASFKAYEEAYQLWSDLATKDPSILNIPADLIASEERADKLKVERLKRNFAFDRARYFIPMCCQTNVVIIMQARGWVDLIQYLASDVRNKESQELAKQLNRELNKVTPRLTKHAIYCKETAQGIEADFLEEFQYHTPTDISHIHNADAKPFLQIVAPQRGMEKKVKNALKNHNNRYAYFGRHIKRIIVRFGWEALTIAELRDLNRHRTGNKDFTLVPVGFYCSDDEIEKHKNIDPEITKKLLKLREIGVELTQLANLRFQSADSSFVYYLPMGAKCRYEHVTTANHFLYQCELRTGLGAHFTYATRMREVLELWHQIYPETRSMIKPGNAEPE